MDGSSHRLDTVQDLINYNNNVLKPAIGTPGFANPGETQQAAYDRWFNEAAKTQNYKFEQPNPITPTPDSLLPTKELWVLAATGSGSTATLKNGGQIDHRTGQNTGGGMLAEEGGKAVIEEGANLSGVFSSLVVRGAGSVGENHGVISGGYYVKPVRPIKTIIMWRPQQLMLLITAFSKTTVSSTLLVLLILI